MTTREVKKRKQSEKSILAIFKVFVIAGNIFGLFPVDGVRSSDERNIKYKWTSLKTLLSLLTCLGGLYSTSIHLRHTFMYGVDQTELDRLIFNGAGALACILFIRIAQKWPNIMQEWLQVENHTAFYEHSNKSYYKSMIIFVIFLGLQAMHIVLYDIYSFWFAYQCKHSFWDALEFYAVEMTFQSVFEVITYTPWMAIIIKIVDTRMALSWLFMDMLLVIVSICLADNFKIVTKKIDRMQDLEVNVKCVWSNIRVNYTKIQSLCLLINESIGYMVLLSFGTNTYSIISQLFDSLRERQTVPEKIYFYATFIITILRTISLCLFCGSVYEESRKPFYTLVTLPCTIYNEEIERLIQLCEEASAITGDDFFVVKKNLIMKIATAVVTYELIMIQFNIKHLKTSETSFSC